ncbi:MAG: glycogen synthase GlgA [Magnetococcus sp. WYHC-3]
MNVLLVASEAFPLIKTGGLGDVAGALPAALRALGHDARLLLPHYPGCAQKLDQPGEPIALGDPLGQGETRLLPGHMPETGVPVWLLDCPRLYERAGGPYGDEQGRDWPDNHLRFALLAKVAAMIGECGGMMGFHPDVIHANDWQTGLIPVYLHHRQVGGVRTVFTIHNLFYTGSFHPAVLGEIGLPRDYFQVYGLEFRGHVSYMKAGLFYADRLTTVSPTYAHEIQTAEFGNGLEGLLRDRAHLLSGVLNGVDYRTWDPAGDAYIKKRYAADKMAGKAANKKALQKELGLEVQDQAPLFGVVSRLTGQKGIDLILAALPGLLGMEAQLAVLGTGEAELEARLEEAARVHPGRVAARLAYDEALAHRMIAGSDMLLIPSRFEPCGLTQLYALRYGTLPVVRLTGGLADSVFETAQPEQGTGFTFRQATGTELLLALMRAAGVYRQPEVMAAMRHNGMAQEFSWEFTAKKYAALYHEIV